MTQKMERMVGIEPTTLTLATCRARLETCRGEKSSSKQLAEVWKRYISTKDTTTRYWRELNQRFQQEVIPALGSYRLVSNVPKSLIREVIWRKYSKYPVAARTMYEALLPFFKYCQEWDYIKENPMSSLSPPPLVPARQRVLTESEIKAIWRATEDSWYWSPFFRLALLTGLRRQELSWCLAYADYSQDLLIIPSSWTKTREPYLLPMLPDMYLEFDRSVIHAIPSGFSKALKRLQKKSDTKDWRIHDLRRTFASGMASLGVNEWLIERMLNHSIPGIRSVYNRYSYLPEKKKALEKWCRYIISLTKA